MFYTDRRTVFEYKRKDRSSDAEDTFTQFSYACHNLEIKIKTMSVPQAIMCTLWLCDYYSVADQ